MSPYLVILINPVRHFPAWFPGMGFKTVARETAILVREMVDAPYEFVRESIVRSSSSKTSQPLITGHSPIDYHDVQRNGTAIPSLTLDSLNAHHDVGPTERDEHVIKHVAATVYSGKYVTGYHSTYHGC